MSFQQFFDPNVAFDPANQEAWSYDAEAKKIAQRQALAKALAGIGKQEGQMVSGWYVPPSKGASIANTIGQALGGYMQGANMRADSQLDEANASARRAARENLAFRGKTDEELAREAIEANPDVPFTLPAAPQGQPAAQPQGVPAQVPATNFPKAAAAQQPGGGRGLIVEKPGERAAYMAAQAAAQPTGDAAIEAVLKKRDALQAEVKALDAQLSTFSGKKIQENPTTFAELRAQRAAKAAEVQALENSVAPAAGVMRKSLTDAQSTVPRGQAPATNFPKAAAAKVAAQPTPAAPVPTAVPAAQPPTAEQADPLGAFMRDQVLPADTSKQRRKTFAELTSARDAEVRKKVQAGLDLLERTGEKGEAEAAQYRMANKKNLMAVKAGDGIYDASTGKWIMAPGLTPEQQLAQKKFEYEQGKDAKTLGASQEAAARQSTGLKAEINRILESNIPEDAAGAAGTVGAWLNKATGGLVKTDGSNARAEIDGLGNKMIQAVIAEMQAKGMSPTQLANTETEAKRLMSSMMNVDYSRMSPAQVRDQLRMTYAKLNEFAASKTGGAGGSPSTINGVPAWQPGQAALRP